LKRIVTELPAERLIKGPSVRLYHYNDSALREGAAMIQLADQLVKPDNRDLFIG